MYTAWSLGDHDGYWKIGLSCEEAREFRRVVQAYQVRPALCVI